MAKLYLNKLFPKLVSSLAVLLLLRQFRYVVCQSTNSSESPLLPDDEAKALDELMTTLGWDFQQISRSSCDNNFQGIKCNCTYESRTVCHVTGLDLSNCKLDGQINATALTSLVYLQEIDLSYNQLHGSIPVTMGNLSSLTSLDLSTNFLNGSIPSSLENLSSLKYLNLLCNMLSGQIPKELGNLSNLVIMYLGFNELTGQLPPELGRLRSLYGLGLNSNNLSGELPENYANFTSELKRFSVAGNRLTGQIPRFIAKWTELYYLSLSGNDFEGQLPLELLFNMSKLQYLVVSDVRSSAGFPFPKYVNMTAITFLKQGVIWNGICGRITERQRWLSKGERAGSRFSRGVVLSVDLEGLVRVCGGWSVKAGDGAVGSAVRDRERKMRKCTRRLCGCGGELEG
ncbi:LRR receptor-like serine/threonine-protein kinase GSO1 [Populus alba x Populus x berolinensis]|nr:LRR receptor-like serine/threonine-protein kinase GSO1 [Populus alba x Populus x berolinensis]